jgi:hypothetical protein
MKRKQRPQFLDKEMAGFISIFDLFVSYFNSRPDQWDLSKRPKLKTDHWSIKESKMSKALKACSLAYLYLSKLSSETAFSKHLLASICIWILSKDMVLLGLGSWGLNPDLRMLFWSSWGDILAWGGGGGWTIDYFFGSVFEFMDPGFFTCFII